MKQLVWVMLGAALTVIALQLWNGETAQAGEAVAHECMAASVPVLRQKTNKFTSSPKPLPAGWTPVAGGANDDGAFVIACRPAK